MELQKNVHEGLPLPVTSTDCVITLRGDYLYYHYGCDGLDDRGWGCGYRTLQTLCSWLAGWQGRTQAVPGLYEIQKWLVEMEDKPPSFIGSRSWIGCVEAALCVERYCGAPCRILHIRPGERLEGVLETLKGHFQQGGGPVMMGGDTDNASKGILGMCAGTSGQYLLVLDPHFYGRCMDKGLVQREGWVQWRNLNSFEPSSFYNFCLPQVQRETLTEK
ncbi:ufm1-specific protease 1 [Microcaecilia unicolor]|uniref:Inactive Ufm1-specific protease 1 n=1 Tax=Microcaecilia unicolor TaxID=1415580 RepID=A0A6P7WRR7_9AMPH|nr:ufm1-specific protease 1-like [Microcaecilia unicolor]XP_030043871.1 ufm1-specific protease 1-like [Microcaecilia unicolor]XP_030043872.1 ufm1-specific protease 1-like [Microcaecilia unicolor]XP_030044051.1 inactive Ufm1-specific protease 1 [Microcaecilia unicolor]XP_030044052.1 inactive Ufm1-specific protease 1 [Microcaecilia unicolor]XP_030044053.1 inactive Ufm1-specific protease 1 [Microcaecilia unicolor]